MFCGYSTTLHVTINGQKLWRFKCQIHLIAVAVIFCLLVSCLLPIKSKPDHPCWFLGNYILCAIRKWCLKIKHAVGVFAAFYQLWKTENITGFLPRPLPWLLSPSLPCSDLCTCLTWESSGSLVLTVPLSLWCKEGLIPDQTSLASAWLRKHEMQHMDLLVENMQMWLGLILKWNVSLPRG